MHHVHTDAQRKHCYYSGRVQGIGFRYTACNLAIGYDVTGFVRNLKDGRVELVAEGPECECTQFLNAIRERMGKYIQEAQQNDEPATGEYQQFAISR